MPDEMRSLIEKNWDSDKTLRPKFDEIHDILETMSKKKTSYGCLEMASKPMRRIPSKDCVF